MKEGSDKLDKIFDVTPTEEIDLLWEKLPE
jgi:hypothetical protein